jgi:hypothetical protein
MQEMTSFVGIDVSKTRLDGHVLPAGTTFAFGNHEPGLQELIAHLVTVVDDAGRAWWCSRLPAACRSAPPPC